MRWFSCALAALALSACGQAENTKTTDNTEAASCVHSARHAVEWSRDGVNDVITTSSDGPTCKQAAVTLVVRNADGNPLWVFASSHAALSTGDVLLTNPQDVSPEQIEAFLASWGEVSATRSGTLPEWAPDAAAPAAVDTAFTYQTPLAREAYNALRGSDVRMICYAVAVFTTQCLVIDPQSMRPTPIVTYG